MTFAIPGTTGSSTECGRLSFASFLLGPLSRRLSSALAEIRYSINVHVQCYIKHVRICMSVVIAGLLCTCMLLCACH